MAPRRTAGGSKAREAHSSAATAPPVDRATTLLDHADDATHVVMFREENAGGRWDYIEQFDVATVRAVGLEEFILQHYGGGRYKAGLRERQSGKYADSVVISIAGARKSDSERNAQRPASAAAAAPAASSTNNNPPSWIEKIILPIGVTMATAFGSLLAKKLLETPAPDPLLVELVKRNKPAAGDGLNPIELMKMVGDAEDRGERRGREVGRLAAAADGAGSGVGSAIQDALPVVNRLLDAHERQIAGPRPALENTQLPPAPSADATPATDIIPVWLRPYMRYKPFILDAADAEETDAEPIAGMVIRNSNEPTWAAIVNAEAAGRLESDIFAALPELATTERRKKFVTAIVAELREAIHAPDEEEEPPKAVNDA